jgi:pimeloyl-ACP methyl ester carboxylesterase
MPNYNQSNLFKTQFKMNKANKKTILGFGLASLALLLAGNSLLAQPFQVGHASITFTDPARNNRSIPTEIYYPADAAGDNVPLSAAGGNFPVISFGHGFVMTWDAYQNIWEALTPQGFILALPKTEGSFSPSHLDLGKDLAFVISSLQALGQNDNSIFFNRVDSNCAVMGHSMGGGAAHLAAAMSPFITAIAALAPAETNPSAIEAAGETAIPALVIAGGNDCVTPPAAHQLPIFEALSSACKHYISIDGASHCQMANYNFLCSFGENTCTPAPAISREEQHLALNKFLLPWLKFQLKGDCAAGESFDTLVLDGAAISHQGNCDLCNVSSTTAITAPRFRVYPNPFAAQLQISADSEFEAAEFFLYNLIGQLVLKQSFAGQTTLHTDALAPGTYFFEIKDGEARKHAGSLVKKPE